MTTSELLSLLPSSYAEHSNEYCVYNTEWDAEQGTDYAIEIVWNQFEVRHTGNTIIFDNLADVIDYISL